MNKAELKKLNNVELQALYLAESKLLYQNLLAGTSWEDLTDQRKYLISIGVIIDEKKHSRLNALIAAELQRASSS